MNRPEKLTLQDYWEANSSEERIKIIEDAFAWIEYLENENEWNTNIEEMPLNTEILFVSDNEVRFGHFYAYSKDRLENLSEIITHDGDGKKYDKSEILKWRLLPKQ